MTLPVHIAFDALSGVDGSARFSFGSTAAIASVSGPIAARIAAEHPVRATIDLHVRPLSSVPGTTEKHAGIALKGILERACILVQHPRTLIQVVVQALSPLSSSRSGEDVPADVFLAVEINACSLALLNAGSIPMRGVVCAVVVVQPTPTSQPRLVTASGDRSPAEHVGCFAFLFGVDHTHTSTGGTGTGGFIPPSKMVWTNYRASPGKTFSATALARAENVASEGAAVVWTKMKESLRASSFAGDGALS